YQVIETRGKHHGKSNYKLNKHTFSAANSTNLSTKQQIFLGNLLSDKFSRWHFYELKLSRLNVLVTFQICLA
ncbi:hypothetical protein BgiMline_030344, partial [Biomphalaria glabrata]